MTERADTDEKQFLFRFVLVPWFSCLLLTAERLLEPKIVPLWQFLPATYVHGFERSFLEMESSQEAALKTSTHLLGRPSKKGKHKRYNDIDRSLSESVDDAEEKDKAVIDQTDRVTSAKLQQLVNDSLARSNKTPSYWLKRFDAWRRAAEASFFYYMKKQSRDIGASDSDSCVCSGWRIAAPLRVAGSGLNAPQSRLT